MSEEQIQVNEENEEFDLDAAWEAAHNKTDKPKPSPKPIDIALDEEDPTPASVKKEPVTEKAEDKEEDEVEKEVVKKDKPSDNKADTELQVKFENLEKSYKDTQKAFHEDRKKLSAYNRAIKSFVDEGTLTDDEAKTLLDHVKFEDGHDIPQNSGVGATGILKYTDAIKKELAMMQRYSSSSERNKEIELHTKAFEHLHDTSTWEEQQEIVNELSGFEDDIVDMTKQMLLLGARHYDEVYSEIHQSGGVKQLKEKYISEIETLKKELDKSKKQYVKLKEKYEDYNEPTVVTAPGGSSAPSSSKSGELDIDGALDWAYRG